MTIYQKGVTKISSMKETAGSTSEQLLVAHPGNQGAGTGEVIRHTAQLKWARQAPGLT